jgi:uncharacterized membrane protein
VHDALLPLAIIALGGFLRFYRIGSEGLWLDEAFSVWMGRQPVGQMLGWLVRIDQHPPLYYLLLHAWMCLGDGEAAVRALSALCSTLTIPAVYLLGRRLLDERAGLLAALILAVSPFHVRLAQEARMYALLALNASLALHTLARLLTDPCAIKPPGRQLVSFWRAWRTARRRPPWGTIDTDLSWLGYVVFTTATLFTHNTAVFLPIAANLLVFGLLLVQRASVLPSPCPSVAVSPLFLRNWLLAQLAVCLLWLPWLPALAAQAASVYREFWILAPTWMTIVGTVGVFASDSLPLLPVVLGAAGLLYASLAALGIARLRRSLARLAFLLVVFATPIVGEWLISLCRPIFYDRTLIWASIPFYVLLATGALHLRRWPHVLAVVLMLLTLNGLSLHNYYVHFEKEQWDDAAALVAERARPDDLVLFNTAWGQIPFDYYFHRLSDVPAVEHGVPVDLFDRGILEPKMAVSDLPRLRALVQGRRQVWLIYSHEWYTDPGGLIPSALEEELDLLDRWGFHGLQVRLYAESD